MFMLFLLPVDEFAVTFLHDRWLVAHNPANDNVTFHFQETYSSGRLSHVFESGGWLWGSLYLAGL